MSDRYWVGGAWERSLVYAATYHIYIILHTLLSLSTPSTCLLVPWWLLWTFPHLSLLPNLPSLTFTSPSPLHPFHFALFPFLPFPPSPLYLFHFTLFPFLPSLPLLSPSSSQPSLFPHIQHFTRTPHHQNIWQPEYSTRPLPPVPKWTHTGEYLKHGELSISIPIDSLTCFRSPCVTVIMYFECITELDVQKCLASTEGGAHMHFIDESDIPAFTHCVWAPPSVEVQHIKLRDVLKIHKDCHMYVV